MKKLLLVLFITNITNVVFSQTGHEIKINLKNSKDTLAYLTFYQFDKNMIADTCKNIKNGKIIFKGKKTLPKGIYSLVSQKKSICFDFFIDENTQFLEITADASTDFTPSLNSTNSKIQNNFFDYLKYIDTKRKEFDALILKTKGMSKTDSIAFMKGKQKPITESISDYENRFVEQNKGTYIGDVLNLKSEKLLKDIPKASNGRPDSIVAFKYYKKHYWDNINFKDEGIVRTPFFHTRIKNYFESIVTRHPDSVIVEVDRILNLTDPKTIVYKLLLAHFTNTYEISKIMGFDKVFVHISDTYFKTGRGNDLYNDDNVVKNIMDRADVLRPILIGEKAPDISMIPIESADRISQMGFEKVKTSDEVTKLYYDNIKEIEKTFLHLHDINANYLLLVFWDVDCSHCQVEIPKLLELYHELKKEKDLKIFCVYTQQEVEKYKKYVNDKKLDWINVYDGVHFNNLKVKYDIYSTPVIYVLDKNKKIIAKRIGVEQIKDILTLMESDYKNGKK